MNTFQWGLQTDTIRLDSSSFKGREGASAAAHNAAFFCINVHLQRKEEEEEVEEEEEEEEELSTVCHGLARLLAFSWSLYMFFQKERV